MMSFLSKSQQKAGALRRPAGWRRDRPSGAQTAKGEPTGEMFEKDDHLRPETTMEGLAKLKAAFARTER